MAFFWVTQGGSDAACDPAHASVPPQLTAVGVGRRFDNQADAEAWLSESYEDLLDLEVAEVTLFNDDQLVYGPMPLTR